MDLLKNIAENIVLLNEDIYLDHAKNKMDFDKGCYSIAEAKKFVTKLAEKLGDKITGETWRKRGRYVISYYGETVKKTFTWSYSPMDQSLSVHFKDSKGYAHPKYVYPKHEWTDFVSKIYKNERTGEVDVDYTANKNEAYAIPNTDEAIRKFRAYMDSTGHNGKDMYFEDFTNKPKKVYKI